MIFVRKYATLNHIPVDCVNLRVAGFKMNNLFHQAKLHNIYYLFYPVHESSNESGNHEKRPAKRFILIKKERCMKSKNYAEFRRLLQ